MAFEAFINNPSTNFLKAGPCLATRLTPFLIRKVAGVPFLYPTLPPAAISIPLMKRSSILESNSVASPPCSFKLV